MEHMLCVLLLSAKTSITSELIGFWTLPIVRYSKTLENTMFRKQVLFLLSGEG
jgi:hypothetical protein